MRPVGVFTGTERHHGITWQRGNQVRHQGRHLRLAVARLGFGQGRELLLFPAHAGGPFLPGILDRQIHQHQVADKHIRLGHDLVGNRAGTASQGGIDGDQEVVLFPVLARGETIGDDIARDGAHEDQQVGFLQQVIGWTRAAIADRADIGRGVEGDGTLAAPFRSGRQVVFLQPAGEDLGALMGPVVAAEDEQRLFGFLQRGIQGLPVGHRHTAGRHRDGRVDLRGDLLGNDVLRQADNHRTGPPGHGGEHGLGDHFAGTLGVVQDHDAFGAGAKPGLGIEFLERLLFAVFEGNQPDKQHHGGGILPGRVQSDQRVGRTGTTGHHGDTRALMQFSVGFGHVRGAAFMAGDHGFDGGFVQPVQDIEVAFSGDNVGALHAVGLQGVDNDMSRRLLCRAVTVFAHGFRHLSVCLLDSVATPRGCIVENITTRKTEHAFWGSNTT